MSKPSKTLNILQRVRALEKTVRGIQGVLPYLKDCITVTKILMDRGVITQDDITNEYSKIKQSMPGDYGTNSS